MSDLKRTVDIQSVPLFVSALPVLQTLKEAGHEAVFVGGSVRDLVLGKEISDVDIATSATPEEVKSLFSHTVDVGIEHGTVLVLHHHDSYEVTTFRTEGTYQDFRHPDSVTFVRSLEEDLMRRDFTINALAVNDKEEIVDYFNGIEDLDRGIIRCVGNPMERFNEDALRMMRAVRFAGQLGFTIESDTFNAIRSLKANLERVAVERMKVEFEKMILSPHRALAFKAFVESELYHSCPDFKEAKETLLKIGAFPLEKLTITQAWILFAYYEQLTVPQIRKVLKDWKSSNEQISTILTGYQTLLARLEKEWDAFLAYECPEGLAIEVEQLLPGIGHKEQLVDLEEVYQQLPIRSMKDIQIDGFGVKEALGLEKMGPIIGEVLQALQTEILSGRLHNENADIVSWIRNSFSESK